MVILKVDHLWQNSMNNHSMNDQELLGKLLDYMADDKFGTEREQLIKQVNEYEMKYTLAGNPVSTPQNYFHQYLMHELNFLRSQITVVETENHKTKQDLRDLAAELQRSETDPYYYKQTLVDRLNQITNGY